MINDLVDKKIREYHDTIDSSLKKRLPDRLIENPKEFEESDYELIVENNELLDSNNIQRYWLKYPEGYKECVGQLTIENSR